MLLLLFHPRTVKAERKLDFCIQHSSYHKQDYKEHQKKKKNVIHRTDVEFGCKYWLHRPTKRDSHHHPHRHSPSLSRGFVSEKNLTVVVAPVKETDHGFRLLMIAGRPFTRAYHFSGPASLFFVDRARRMAVTVLHWTPSSCLMTRRTTSPIGGYAIIGCCLFRFSKRVALTRFPFDRLFIKRYWNLINYLGIYCVQKTILMLITCSFIVVVYQIYITKTIIFWRFYFIE